MISFAIDTTSKTAVYKQLISAVSDAVKDGRLKTGELVPSMNALSGELGISKETVKRAAVERNPGSAARQGILRGGHFRKERHISAFPH